MDSNCTNYYTNFISNIKIRFLEFSADGCPESGIRQVPWPVSSVSVLCPFSSYFPSVHGFPAIPPGGKITIKWMYLVHMSLYINKYSPCGNMSHALYSDRNSHLYSLFRFISNNSNIYLCCYFLHCGLWLRII